MGTGSFPGVKQPGRGVDHPAPFSAEVNERVELIPLLPVVDLRGLLWGELYVLKHNTGMKEPQVKEKKEPTRCS
jgi:hypothetical protein